MQIKCIRYIYDITGEELSELSHIKKDKIYLVFAVSYDTDHGLSCFIQSEHENRPFWVSLAGFEVIDQEIPSSWVIEKYEFENRMIIYQVPKPWSYQSFFEDLSEDEPRAVELFKQEAKKIADWES